jgi:GTP-sensing pleiotropic transcriptional regulator CodY
MVVITILLVIVFLTLLVLTYNSIERARERPVFRRAMLTLVPEGGNGKRSGTLAVDAEFDDAKDEADMRTRVDDFITAKWSSDVSVHDFVRLLYAELSAMDLQNVQVRYSIDPLEFISFGYQPG